MRMLGAGGLPLFYDRPDSFEHSGYLDFIRHRDIAWLDGAEDCGVKWLDPLMHGFPPRDREYRIITLTRDVTQQYRSAVKFLRALSHMDIRESREGRRALAKDNARLASAWANHGSILPLTFERLIDDPLGTAAELRDFCELGDERLMAAQVVRRGSACLPDLLEMRFPVGLWQPEAAGR